MTTNDDGFGAVPIGLDFLRRKLVEAEGIEGVSRMRHEQHLQSVYAMLDTMPVEHLVLWRKLLDHMSRQNANYLEGTIVTILRCIHQVCPLCGEPAHETAGTTCPE